MKAGCSFWLRKGGISVPLGERSGLSNRCRSVTDEKRTTITRQHRARIDRGAMPTSRLHRVGVSRGGRLGRVALSSMHNKAVNADAQGRPLAPLAPVLGRGLLLR